MKIIIALVILESENSLGSVQALSLNIAPEDGSADQTNAELAVGRLARLQRVPEL
jgi:hypothetical protein